MWSKKAFGIQPKTRPFFRIYSKHVKGNCLHGRAAFNNLMVTFLCWDVKLCISAGGEKLKVPKHRVSLIQL